MQLSDQQGQAVKAMAGEYRGGSPVSVLAGLAGSGKTSIASDIVEASGAKNPLFVAPTNKAARVLSEKMGRSVTSIHKAIYFPPEDESDDKNFILTWEVCEDAAASRADLILVDEASMVGSKVGGDLASFGVPIIAIGDPGQLPPVNDDPFFNFEQPTFTLTEIHRQARDNPIIRLCHDVREGKSIKEGVMGDKVIITRPGSVDITPENVPQFITGTHKKKWQVTAKLRKLLGYHDWLPEPGEPLLCRKNSQDHNLINGMICQSVTSREGSPYTCVLNLFNDEDQWLEVESSTAHFKEHKERKKSDYPPQKTRHELFDFAHAITCHSAQGSQWDHVLVCDEGYIFREEAARWRYTAFSRAADRLTVILS